MNSGDYGWINEIQQFDIPADPKPLFPESVGEVLHAVLDPEPLPGPPYTHTFNLPPTEYDEDGEPLPPRVEPTITIARHVPDEDLVEAYNAAGRWLYETDVHPLLRDHGIDRCLP